MSCGVYGFQCFEGCYSGECYFGGCRYASYSNFTLCYQTGGCNQAFYNQCYSGGYSVPYCIFSGIGCFFSTGFGTIAGGACTIWGGLSSVFCWNGGQCPSLINCAIGCPSLGLCCYNFCQPTGITNCPSFAGFCCPLQNYTALQNLYNCPNAAVYHCPLFESLVQQAALNCGLGYGCLLNCTTISHTPPVTNPQRAHVPLTTDRGTAPMYCTGSGKLNVDNQGYYLSCHAPTGSLMQDVREPCGSEVKHYTCGKIQTIGCCGLSETWDKSNPLTDASHSLNSAFSNVSGGLNALGGDLVQTLDNVGAFFTNPTTIILIVLALVGVGVTIHLIRSRGGKPNYSAMPIPIPV